MAPGERNGAGEPDILALAGEVQERKLWERLLGTRPLVAGRSRGATIWWKRFSRVSEGSAGPGTIGTTVR